MLSPRSSIYYGVITEARINISGSDTRQMSAPQLAAFKSAALEFGGIKASGKWSNKKEKRSFVGNFAHLSKGRTEACPDFRSLGDDRVR